MKTIGIYTEKWGYIDNIKPMNQAELFLQKLRYLFSDNETIGEDIHVYEERYTGNFYYIKEAEI